MKAKKEEDRLKVEEENFMLEVKEAQELVVADEERLENETKVAQNTAEEIGTDERATE